MRILVYGAGVMGCELAHVLMEGNNDVTLLARGSWKEILDSRGLTIRHFSRFKTTVEKVRTIDGLDTGDIYDLIFVTMQQKSLKNVLPILAANKSTRIIFIGNNMYAGQCCHQLKAASSNEKAVAFGFQSTGGRRENGRIISIYKEVSITLGGADRDLDKGLAEALENAFKDTECSLKREPMMDAWLKSHMAFILPFCFLCYAMDGKLKRAGKKDINLLIDACNEGYGLLKAAGCPIRPEGDDKFYTEQRKKAYWLFKLMIKTPIGKLAIGDHAMNGVEEMKAMDEAFQKLREEGSVSMKNWDILRKRAEKYIKN